MTIWIVFAAFLALALWFGIEKSRRRSHPMTGGIDRSRTLPHKREFELYSNSFSHCSRKTRLAMAELDIDYKYHPIDLIETGWYQTISPQYLRVNPAGILPTLVHNGHPVYESDDILAYAQEVAGHEAPQLVPADPALRDEMNSWLEFCSISSADPMAEMPEKAGACIPGLTMPLFVTAIPYIPLRKILVGFLFHPDKRRPAFFTASKLFGLRRMLSQKMVRNIAHPSRDHMAQHLLTIDTALAKSDGYWILGKTYSLADITIGCMLLRLEETGWLDYFAKTQNVDELKNYFQRLKARPSWQAAIGNHTHPIIEKAKQDLAHQTSQSVDLYSLVYSG